jgi:hypothetical protein
MLGDNAYNDGTNAQYQAAVFDMYPSLLARSVLWPTFGNHDAISASSITQSGPYYDLFTLPAAGEAAAPLRHGGYYSFDHGASISCARLPGVGPIPAAPCSPAPERSASTDREWIIAFGTIRPTARVPRLDFRAQLIQMRQNVLPILEDAGSIRAHGPQPSYERSFLLTATTASPGRSRPP